MTYKLTTDPDRILCLETNESIPRDHRDWSLYEQFLADGGVPEPAMPPMNKAALKVAATEERWKRETGGIELNGVRVGTTIDDQNRLSGVLSAIALGGFDTVDFKASNGWVQLGVTELQGIAQAISAHVQACFSAERAHHEAIEQLQFLDGYDVTQGWPG